MDNCYSNSLYHYGILGQKWGIRRYQNPDGTLTPAGKERYAIANLKNAYTANIDKWGKDKDHNILYIAGASGSGKSTVAEGLSKNTNVIHLDLYLEDHSDAPGGVYRDSEFDKYMNKHLPEYTKLSNFSELSVKSPERWKLVDQMMEESERFAKGQFVKGKNVIIEGVQLNDQTVYPDKNFFKDKPMIILKTNSALSIARAAIRDDKNFNNVLKNIKNYVDTYSRVNSNLDSLINLINAKKGSTWLNKKIGVKNET